MIQDPQLQQMVIDTLLTTLQDPSPEIRAKSAQALGEIGYPAVISELLTALQDPAPIVRQNAAIALSKLGNDTYIDKLSAPPDQGA
jgi:HEAT repeat protein